MYTRLKPQRVKTSNIPTPGQGLGYIDPENFQWQNIVGDMQYSDFEWHTLTGDPIVINNIANNYTPSSDFTVQAGTVKPGIEYYLRVNTGNTPHIMTLGVGTVNPNGYDTTLKANTIHILKFMATSTNQLEFEGVDTSNFVTLNTVQSITAQKTFGVEPILPNKTTPATNSGTAPATEAQVYKKADDDKVVHLAGAETITGVKTFGAEPVLPNKTAAATNSGTKPATEAQVYNVDSNAVKLTGNQTVNGEKTFTTSPVVPAKSTDADSTKTTVIATEAQVAKKANRANPATADNLASLTATGDLSDSGIAKTSVELNTNKETGNVPTDSTSLYPSSHTVKKYVDDQVAAATAGAVSDAAYGSGWDGVTGIAPSKNAVYDKISTIDSSISTIEGKIPSEASTSNQLADKAFVNSSINSVTAYYITKNAAGDQFATYAELSAATTFYSGGVVRVPTRNDYCIVQDDETHDHATTRYIYNNGWEYQYTVNETALTQAQLDAINSGITANKVSTYDGYATLISGKQDALANQTAYTAKGTATKVPQITTNSLGQVTGITEVDITHPVATSAIQGTIKLGSDTVQTVAPNAVSSEGSRTYAVQVNSSGQAVVNVPWNDTIQAIDSSLDITSLNPVQNAVITGALNGKQDKATSGSTAPSSTPTYVGQAYVDTTNNKYYVAVGTSSSSDWFEVGSGSGGGGMQVAPNSPIKPTYNWYGTQAQYDALSQYYTDTPNDTVYHTI